MTRASNSTHNTQSTALQHHGKLVIIMRHSIDSYVRSIATDNAAYINEGGYSSVADYIISGIEDSGLASNEFFDAEELEGGDPTAAQVEELYSYLRDRYNYLPQA